MSVLVDVANSCNIPIRVTPKNSDIVIFICIFNKAIASNRVNITHGMLNCSRRGSGVVDGSSNRVGNAFINQIVGGITYLVALTGS